MSENKMELTRSERLILWNQYCILEAVNPDDADRYSTQKEILEKGYEPFYGSLAEHIYDGEDKLTHDEKSEVWDTLEMFDALKTSAERLGKPELLSGHLAGSFRGYDGNYEGKFLAFAAFTIDRLEQFQYVDRPSNGTYNSHCPMRSTYARMVAKWRVLTPLSRSSLSEAQITDILGND